MREQLYLNHHSADQNCYQLGAKSHTQHVISSVISPGRYLLMFTMLSGLYTHLRDGHHSMCIGVYPLNMVNFHSYVSLLEGLYRFIPITVIYIPSFDRPKHPLEAANCAGEGLRTCTRSCTWASITGVVFFRISGFLTSGCSPKKLGVNRARANPGRTWAMGNSISFAGGTSMTGWWFQTWLDYFPFHKKRDIIRNPLTFIFFKMVKPSTSHDFHVWWHQRFPKGLPRLGPSKFSHGSSQGWSVGECRVFSYWNREIPLMCFWHAADTAPLEGLPILRYAIYDPLEGLPCFFSWENSFLKWMRTTTLKWKPPRGLTLIILLKQKQGYTLWLWHSQFAMVFRWP